MPSKFYRESQITSKPGRQGRYPFTKGTWRRYIRNGDAPAGVLLGPGVRAWSGEELDAWDAQKANPSGELAKPTATPAVNKNPCPPSQRPDAKRPGRPRKFQEAGVPA
jgi:hypothetical protein